MQYVLNKRKNVVTRVSEVIFMHAKLTVVFLFCKLQEESIVAVLAVRASGGFIRGVCFVIVCSSKLFLLVLLEDRASLMWHFLIILTNMFVYSRFLNNNTYLIKLEKTKLQSLVYTIFYRATYL